MSAPGVHDTGPWSLEALEKHLGPSKNQGQIHRQTYIGGETEAIQEYGPFLFKCGCRAQKGGIGGDLYLRVCSQPHGKLQPEGF